MNRGSAQDAAGDTRAPASFNEAPIHESGKFRDPFLGADRALPFNEAPIHESGKWPGPSRGSPVDWPLQ